MTSLIYSVHVNQLSDFPDMKSHRWPRAEQSSRASCALLLVLCLLSHLAEVLGEGRLESPALRFPSGFVL